MSFLLGKNLPIFRGFSSLLVPGMVTCWVPFNEPCLRVWLMSQWSMITLPETNKTHLKRWLLPKRKGNFIFQPSIFSRLCRLVSGRVSMFTVGLWMEGMPQKSCCWGLGLSPSPDLPHEPPVKRIAWILALPSSPFGFGDGFGWGHPGMPVEK